MRNIFWSAFCGLALLASSHAKASPCYEKQVPQKHVNVSVFQDCNDDSVLYFVPIDLRVRSVDFDGSKSFTWLNTPDGGANVAMDLQLFNSDGLIIEAMRDLKQILPKRYRLVPFEVKDVRMDGLGGEEDGVVDQKFTTTAGFSTDLFKLSIKLNKDGVDLWKQSAEQGSFIIQAATLNYKMKIVKGGEEQWIDTSTTLSLDSIPDCVITNQPCPTRDRNEALLTSGSLYGEKYFFMQFVQCSDFVTGVSFNTPSKSEVTRPHLSLVDVNIVYNAALQAFDAARESQRRDCRPYIDDYLGYNWMIGLGRDKGISCKNAKKWPWTAILPLLPVAASAEYVSGVKRAHGEVLASGDCPKLVVCEFDSRQPAASKCPAILQSPKKMCIQAAGLKALVDFETGHCEFASYRWTSEFNPSGEFMENWVQVVKKNTALSRTEDTCVDLKKSILAGEAFLGKVMCYQ